jgi:hypothetical protein
MFVNLKAPVIIVCVVLLGSTASAKDEEFKFLFSQSDGTGEPSDICLSRAKELAERMESASIKIKKMRHSENRGANDIHPRATISVTYDLANNKKARIYLTCSYGKPIAVTKTKSGAECIEIDGLSFPEDTEPGVQDSFQIRLDDYEDYGGEAGIELLANMVDQYKKENNPAQTAPKYGCEKLE